jgi:hypothetical protein
MEGRAGAGNCPQLRAQPTKYHSRTFSSSIHIAENLKELRTTGGESHYIFNQYWEKQGEIRKEQNEETIFFSGKQEMTIQFKSCSRHEIFIHPLYWMVKYLNHVKKVLHLNTQLGNLEMFHDWAIIIGCQGVLRCSNLKILSLDKHVLRSNTYFKEIVVHTWMLVMPSYGVSPKVNSSYNRTPNAHTSLELENFPKD